MRYLDKMNGIRPPPGPFTPTLGPRSIGPPTINKYPSLSNGPGPLLPPGGPIGPPGPRVNGSMTKLGPPGIVGTPRPLGPPGPRPLTNGEHGPSPTVGPANGPASQQPGLQILYLN